MYTKLRQRLFTRAANDTGFSLIEVVVAMFIFTIISVALLYTMTNLLSVTRDSRNRQVAANLAAQEIDLARDINNVFDINSYSTERELNGDTFTITREQDWVYSTGGTAACGAGTGALRYKFVEVQVVWDNMRGSTGVKSETFINPNERINDPAKGTMIISVNTFDGEGVQGASITATPTAGASVTANTDSDGCAFILGVAPGAYTVKVSSPPSTSYVDLKGISQPTQNATVVAATSVSVPFTFDPSGTLRVTYNTAGMTVPSNLPTTLLSTRDPVVNLATAAANPRSFLVSPWPDGYSVVAGDALACFANDPSRWTASGAKANGELPEPVAPVAGSVVDALAPTVPVTITSMPTGSGSNRFLVAVSRDAPGGGQPGCATQQVLRFAQATSSTMTIALPYGTWDLHRSSTSGFAPSGSTRFNSGITAGPGGTVASGVITLDPRGAA